MPISPFRQTGPTVVIIASTNATANFCPSSEPGPQQYICTNSDTTNDAYICFAANEGQALANAIVPAVNSPQNVYRILHASQITLTGPANAWVGAVSVASTARIDITPGYGS